MDKETNTEIEKKEDNKKIVKSQFLVNWSDTGNIEENNETQEKKVKTKSDDKIMNSKAKSKSEIKEKKSTNKPVTTKKKSLKSNHKVIKKIIICIVAVICICIGLIFTNYFYVNSRICDLANSGDSNIINVKTYLNNLLLQDKTIQAIQNSNKNVRIEYNGNFITIPFSEVSNNKKIKINIKEKADNIPEFKGMKCLYIQDTGFSSITVKLPRYLTEKKVVDIYTIKENNKAEIYRKSVDLEGENSLTIESAKEVSGYVIIYIPVKDIILKGQRDMICINQNAPTDVKFTYVPENATLTRVQYEPLDTKLVVVHENKLIGLKYGESKVKITNQNGEFSKEINVKVDKYIIDIRTEMKLINLQLGGKYKLSYTITPNNAITSDILMESSNPEVAKIENNEIIGVSNGTCKIVLRTATGSYIERQIDVNISNDVETISYGDGELTYIKGILIANKTYKLPSTYNPGMNKEVLEAFSKMKADAAKERVKLSITSDYRSYKVQDDLYNSYVRTKGKEKTDNSAARAGYSEHQTGLAIDVNTVGDEFANTTESNWLARNSYKYGFIVRYPYGKEHITGYKYEPWHIRYIGVENAKNVYESGLCLEEYLGISSQYQE